MTKKLDPTWPVFRLDDESEGLGELLYELNPDSDRAGQKYVMVGQFLEDNDFYQGLNKITVIRRVEDDKLFGYSWWDDISKHGEAYMESNGDEFGLEGYCEVEDDWDTFVSFAVFEPVEEYSIRAFRKTT